MNRLKSGRKIMNCLSIEEAADNLNELIDQVTESHQAVLIKGAQNDIVIIAKEEWSAIEETIYLNSVPGYVESHEVSSSPREEWVNAQKLGL
jgi:antitoxin YefM